MRVNLINLPKQSLKSYVNCEISILFRKILSFCSMLARDFSCAATVYYQKINRSKIKLAENWCCSDGNALSFFPVQCCLESLWH